MSPQLPAAPGVLGLPSLASISSISLATAVRTSLNDRMVPSLF